MIEKDQPQRQAPKQVEPQIAIARRLRARGMLVGADRHLQPEQSLSDFSCRRSFAEGSRRCKAGNVTVE